MSHTPIVLTAPTFPAPGLEVARSRLAKVPATAFIKALRRRLEFALDRSRSPMRLFPESRTIFVRIPRNASTSLSAWLYPDAPADWLPHYGADFYRRVFPARFRDYLVFAPLRHPFDRLASSFAYYRHHSRVPAERRLMDNELSFLKSYPDFISWVNDQPDLARIRIMSWHHFRPQRDFVTDPAGKVIVDLMWPVEDMEHGVSLLARHVGVRGPMPTLNRSAPVDKSDVNLGRLRAYYADDFRLWSAAFDQGVLMPTGKLARWGWRTGN